jgi:hypothetical protein
MRQPVFPFMLLIVFSANFIFFSYQSIDAFLIQGFSKNLLILIFCGILFSLFSGGLFLAFHTRYKREMHLILVCTKPSIGKVKIVALSSHNTGHSNPTFMTIDFEGHERTFNNISDELRFKYKHDDNIDVLYNPVNKSEFVFT